jgi:hypothetical protein
MRRLFFTTPDVKFQTFFLFYMGYFIPIEVQSFKKNYLIQSFKIKYPSLKRHRKCIFLFM